MRKADGSSYGRPRVFSMYIRNYINKLPIDNILYNTIRTIPGGARYHDWWGEWPSGSASLR